jgi:hypothetical protein
VGEEGSSTVAFAAVELPTQETLAVETTFVWNSSRKQSVPDHVRSGVEGQSNGERLFRRGGMGSAHASLLAFQSEDFASDVECRKEFVPLIPDVCVRAVGCLQFL